MVVTFVSFLLLAKLLLFCTKIPLMVSHALKAMTSWCGVVVGTWIVCVKKIFSDVLQTSLIMMKETRNVGSPEMTGRQTSTTARQPTVQRYSQNDVITAK